MRYITFEGTALVRNGYVVLDNDHPFEFDSNIFRRQNFGKFVKRVDGAFEAQYGMHPNEGWVGTYMVIPRIPNEATTTVSAHIEVEIPEVWRTESRYICPICTDTGPFSIQPIIPCMLRSKKKSGCDDTFFSKSDSVRNAEIDRRETRCTCPICGTQAAVINFECDEWEPTIKG